jgi:hypothetical protein
MQAKSAAGIAAVLLALARPAHADGDAPEVRDTARAIAQTGAHYFDLGAWEKARDHFHRAYQLVPAPTLLLMEARSLVALGRLVDAVDVYGRAAATPLQADANEAYRRAVRDAAIELAQLFPRVPRVRVVSREPLVKLSVDGLEVPVSRLHDPVPVDPGTHVVDAASDLGATVRETFAVTEGEVHTLTLEAPPSKLAAHPPEGGPTMSVGWLTLGTGVFAVVVGGTTGLLASDHKAKLDAACPAGACPPSAASDFEDYHTLRTASTVAYGVGAVGLVAGVALLLSAKGDPRGAASKANVPMRVVPSAAKHQAGLSVAASF